MIQAPGTGRPTELDPATSRWLAWHEAVSHGLIGREIRDLGDAVMLYDPNDREPFWNRIAGIAWPEDAAAFDRRLLEVIALFASLDRTPHVWPLPGYDEPLDLARRLLDAGFEDSGAGLMMAHDPSRASSSAAAANGRPDVTVERVHLAAGREATRAARGIAVVLAEAFRVEPHRIRAIEEETLALLGRDEFHAILVRVDGEPAATARRTTFAGASYLSSIGTRPAFQGRGLGRVATEVGLRDAVAAGSRWTYLGVFDDNLVARRMYESLGFVVLGGPAPDLMLR
ncbi:MAG TPA: GNAT family N-acetyltransferase [Candidatus Limnocylindrales bacterium]|nr:GNAT family N-acetyltransferase [Candidatus Limnocylindrales bacterium]